MKKIKIIILMFLMISLLTGCTVKSDITMNYDGSVKENVSVLNSSDIMGSGEKLKQIVDNKIEKYKVVLDFKKYNYDYVENEKLSGAKFYKNYDSICSYFGNSAFNQYAYKYIDCAENDYYYEIKNVTSYIPYCPQCGNWPALDDVELKITLPITAEEQNADEVDGNTYIWRYNKDTANKDFYLKINKVSLKENEEAYKQNLENKRRIRIGIIVATISIIILISIIAGRVLYKKYQSNKLDY